MRHINHTADARLRSSTYASRRRETIDFEAIGGEPYFEHDIEARPLARIYPFPQRFSSRSVTRQQRKA